MRTAIFLFPNLTGHLNRTIRLSKFLKKHNIRVVYVGEQNLKKFTFQHDFEFYLINSSPFGIGSEEWLNKEAKDKWLESIIDRFTNKQFKTRQKELDLMMKTLNPTEIFVDVFYFSDFILLYPYLNESERRFIFLLTKLPLQKETNIPPLNTTLLPTQKNINLYWQFYFFKRSLNRISKFIKYLGKDDASILIKMFKVMNIPKSNRIFRNKVFQPSFENVSEWILVPQEIDFFERKLLPWQRFVGLMIDINRNEKLSDEYKSCIGRIEKDKKIIYCSLGTVLEAHLNKQETDLLLFFKTLFNIVREKHDYFLIVSLSENFKNQLGVIPSNVKIFETVPQIDLLKRCNLFITHGGMNSILESSTLGIPMLVYPLNKYWDQSGNAARIQFHEIGLIGNMQKDTNKQIANKIAILLTNSKYKENALNISKILTNKYGNDLFLENFLATELLIQ